MALIECIRVALDALWANKLRAFLTMLGVIIGVSSVIIMVAIVQGLRKQIIQQIGGNGADLIFAFYDPRPDSLLRGGFQGLSMDDVAAIQDRSTLIGPISPTASTSVVASYGDQRKKVKLTGVLASYTDTHEIGVTEGRFITSDDDATWSKACVLGLRVRKKLFPKDDPIGKQIVCFSNGANVSMTVVGVLEEKDQGADGTDFNNGIFASLRSVQQRFTGSRFIEGFSVRSTNVLYTQDAADEVYAALKERHPNNDQDFIVDTQAGLLKQLDVIITTLQVVLGGVGALSLLTGGIGIMNIMLVSVTERTREIGIRKAVGATRAEILLQFVVEAMVVSGCGGLVGVAGGYAVSALIDKFAHQLLPTFVPVWAALLGFGFAMAVGVFFGIYPAIRASRLDPIQALRYE